MPDLDARIERMYRRDRRIAVVLVVVLVITLATVYAAIAPLADLPGVHSALAIAASLLVLFNAAAIWAMLRHNREDKAAIYTLDIRHLDEYRRQRAGRGRRARSAS